MIMNRVDPTLEDVQAEEEEAQVLVPDFIISPEGEVMAKLPDHLMAALMAQEPGAIDAVGEWLQEFQESVNGPAEEGELTHEG